MERVERDAANADLPKDERPLRDGGAGTTAYAEAVGVYLAFALLIKHGKHYLHNRSLDAGPWTTNRHCICASGNSDDLGLP